MKINHKYQSNELVFDKPTWDNHFLPLIETKIQNRINQVPQDIIDRIEAIGNIKLDKKWFLLFNFKKNGNTKTKEDIEESLKLRTKVIEIINPPELVEEIIRNDFKYIEGGPITKELLKTYPVLSRYDWACDLTQNNYTSSWGVFRNHIIINDAKQFIVKTYANKKSVYKIINKREPILFTNVLPNLNFKFKGFRKQTGKSKIFENKDFLSKYNWEWNNDVEIMMFFTPWFQEQFIKVNNEQISIEYSLIKNGNFIWSEYKQEYFTSTFNAKDINYRFLNINDTNTKEYFDLLKKAIIEFLHDKYKSLAFATIIPIIDSEYEKKFIEDFIAKGRLISDQDNANNICNYLINENKLLSINPFTVIDDYDMFMGMPANSYCTSNNIQYYQAPLNRIRCYCKLQMEPTTFQDVYIYTLMPKNKVSFNTNKSLQSAVRLIGQLVYCKVSNLVKYNNGNFYHYSNLDAASTFKLDLIADELKKKYHSPQIIIDNGFISFIIKKQEQVDPQYIERILKVLSTATGKESYE